MVRQRNGLQQPCLGPNQPHGKCVKLMSMSVAYPDNCKDTLVEMSGDYTIPSYSRVYLKNNIPIYFLLIHYYIIINYFILSLFIIPIIIIIISRVSILLFLLLLTMYYYYICTY